MLYFFKCCFVYNQVPVLFELSGLNSKSQKKSSPKTGASSNVLLLKDERDEERATQDQRLYNEVLDAILDLRLTPGVKLKEDELADIFSVSRTVVRRALLRLAHDRIVDLQPNRGATIVRPDAGKAREILSVRRLIEGAVVKEVTEKASKASLDKLRQCVETEQDEVRHQHSGAGLRLSGDFHILLAILSENATLTSYLKELVPQTSLIISLYQRPNHTLCSHQEHFNIIDVIATGDVRKAQETMDHHLQNIENKLNLDSEYSPGDLYAAFSHVIESV